MKRIETPLYSKGDIIEIETFTTSRIPKGIDLLEGRIKEVGTMITNSKLYSTYYEIEYDQKQSNNQPKFVFQPNPLRFLSSLPTIKRKLN